MRRLPNFVALLSLRPRRGSATRPGDAGYALLTVIFLAGVMLLAATVAAPILVTQGRREKEDEMIWRGEQHVRAIKLYYRKMGRFPKDMTDLTDAKNGIHFLRKAYKDPMNTADGSWRFIYIGPGGQLIGSVTRTSLNPVFALQQPGQPGSNPLGIPPQPGAATSRGDQNTSTGGSGAGQNQADANPSPSAPAPPKSAAASAGTPVEGAVFGGNLIGVASKVNRRSFKFYKGYGKYKEWEFIWDPQAEAAAAGVGVRGIQINAPNEAPGPVQPLGFPQPGPPQPVPPQP